MDWNTAQEEALCQVGQWLETKGASQLFRIFGWAGTGKTTLAKHFANSLDGLVLFGAYTGKAALVLRKMGCPEASTIHQMIYRPRDKSIQLLKQLKKDYEKEVDQDRRSQLKIEIDAETENLKSPSFTLRQLDSPFLDAKLVVIDEVSMVNQQMAEDMLSFGTRILVLGDPFQLPPIHGGGYFTQDKPDVMLRDIHRQAKGSPIISLSLDVREGRALQYGDYGECRVLRRGVLKLSEVASYDQILVGRNATRREINHLIRTHLGFSERENGHLPQEGDKLVCLKNNHDIGLLNGSIWTVLRSSFDDDMVHMQIVDFDNPGGEKLDVSCYRHHFEGREDELQPWDEKGVDKFDFGYALTVHKAQGSQWSNVLLIDESGVFRKDQDHWLYTGLTRAQDSITVVR